MELAFVPMDPTAPTDLLAVLLPSTSVPGAISDIFQGQLETAMADSSFEAKVGQTFSLRPLGRIPATWLLLVGLGQGGVDEHRRAAGAAGRFAREKGLRDITLALPGPDPSREQLRALAEGAAAGNYRFDRFKPEQDRKPRLERLRIAGAHGSLDALELGRTHARAQALARDLVNRPAQELYPASLADFAAGLAGARLDVQVWDAARIRSEGMGGIAAVGSGSEHPPRFVHMHWTPRGAPRARVALVGKGVTFDAGGLSLKPSSAMLTMRCDMAGAAAVIAVMSVLERLQPAVEVHGIFAAAENLLGGSAYKLGDVLHMLNGGTVEVHNTDAEGRLLLADCLAYASRLEVDACVDVATLTGAAVVALGEHYTALYSPDDSFAATWLSMAEQAGEGLWRLPLEQRYDKKLESDVAQLKNVGGREGGSITAALFLQHFVDGPTWAHLDIAGPAFLTAKDAYLSKGATGAMVRTMLRWLESY